MSKADEMFMNLGYTGLKETDTVIIYEKIKRLSFGDYWIAHIEFNCEYKIVYSYGKTEEDIIGLSVEELKAVNQKCKELGWIGGEDE